MLADFGAGHSSAHAEQRGEARAMEVGELAFQVDLAAAAIAVVALLYSIRTGVRQRRHGAGDAAPAA